MFQCQCILCELCVGSLLVVLVYIPTQSSINVDLIEHNSRKETIFVQETARWRSGSGKTHHCFMLTSPTNSSQRRAHNPEVDGSKPSLARHLGLLFWCLCLAIALLLSSHTILLFSTCYPTPILLSILIATLFLLTVLCLILVLFYAACS